jgi:uncharacterized damage-inducible protein DinB
MSTIGNRFAAEFKHEAGVTRKLLERIPTEKFSWKPHEKSMTMGRLAAHIIELIWWPQDIMVKPEFDFSSNTRSFDPQTNTELLELFDKNLQPTIESIGTASDEHFQENWTLRMGDHVILCMPRSQVIRVVILNHLIHHRGQLSVYLRLNDISVPSIYGPSADES